MLLKNITFCLLIISSIGLSSCSQSNSSSENYPPSAENTIYISAPSYQNSAVIVTNLAIDTQETISINTLKQQQHHLMQKKTDSNPFISHHHPAFKQESLISKKNTSQQKSLATQSTETTTSTRTFKVNNFSDSNDIYFEI